MARSALLTALIASTLLPGCADDDPDGGDLAQVQLPAGELNQLLERMKSTLLEIKSRCSRHGITAEQIRTALYAADWDNPQADVLVHMPAEIRDLMQSLRDDLMRHNQLVVAAYDQAQGLTPAVEVSP